jgi:hypothetical protein
MATYRLVKAAESLIETVTFDTYNEAIAYKQRTPGASKPFRMNPTDRSSCWAVSRINTKASGAVYKKVPDFIKPIMYDYIQNVTMFLPQPEHVPQAAPSFRDAADVQERPWQEQQMKNNVHQFRPVMQRAQDYVPARPVHAALMCA